MIDLAAVPHRIATVRRNDPTEPLQEYVFGDPSDRYVWFVVNAAWIARRSNPANVRSMTNDELTAAIFGDPWEQVAVDVTNGAVLLDGQIIGPNERATVIGTLHSTGDFAFVDSEQDRYHFLGGLEVDLRTWELVNDGHYDIDALTSWAGESLNHRGVRPRAVAELCDEWRAADGVPIDPIELDDLAELGYSVTELGSSLGEPCAMTNYWVSRRQPLWHRICDRAWPHYRVTGPDGEQLLCARCTRTLREPIRFPGREANVTLV